MFSGLLSALDLVEVNPRLAVSEEEAKATASLAVDVIASSFGQTREGGHVVYDQLPTPSSPDESAHQGHRLDWTPKTSACSLMSSVHQFSSVSQSCPTLCDPMDMDQPFS